MEWVWEGVAAVRGRAASNFSRSGRAACDRKSSIPELHSCMLWRWIGLILQLGAKVCIPIQCWIFSPGCNPLRG